MKRVTLLFALWVVSLLISPAIALEGLVLDADTGEPLVGANVVGDGRGTTTDADGRFELRAAVDSLRVSHVGYRTAILAPDSAYVVVRLEVELLETQEVVVRGGLVEERLGEMDASVTVVGEEELSAAGGGHLQELIQAVPNLSWAGGTARPRYFQIRGIGERSQYAGEGPPNFSVGFVVDDVELSGLGTGSLFDVEQVEVFRGPQSTIFGPNALAGMINLASADPGSVVRRSVGLGLGSDGLKRLSGSFDLPLGERLSARAGYQAARSNGFRENEFLGVDDSNRRREDVARLKLRYLDASGLMVLGTLFRVDADNGYDGWAPDNNEALKTYADKPGKDHQTTDAFSLRVEMPLKRWGAELVSITAYSQTGLEYSYDGDWGNDDFWKRNPYDFDPEVEGWSYDFFDRTLRQRDSFSQELRLRRDGLLVGLYAKDLQETDAATGYLFGGDATDLHSQFALGGLAFYGQYDRELAERLELSLNLRLDRSGIDYEGVTNGGGEEVRFDVDHWLPGGKIALSYRLDERRRFYGAISRGYRAGGINQHPYLAAENRPYDPEYLLNFETGLRFAGEWWRTALTLFYARRTDQQVNLSSQQNPGDPNSFFYFTANASSGHNSGLELEQSYKPHPELRLFGSLGYLKTHVDAYTFQSGAGEVQRLGDRAAAHAPEYTLRLGGEYGGRRGPFARLEWSATDQFYFSDSHDQIAAAHQLLNGSVGYRNGRWSVRLWGENLLDERYAVRGFYFGLEPPDYADTLYLSYGDPRQGGVSLQADF